MQKPDIVYRAASGQDIEGINRVVEAAVITWNLPERVKRLTIPGYRYNTFDLQCQTLWLAETDTAGIVGIMAVEEAQSADLPPGKTGLLLHGLYVLPDWHRQGIGKGLVDAALQQVQAAGKDGLLVKAQTDACGFFETLGFQRLAVSDDTRDYHNRYWLEYAGLLQ